MPFSATSIGIAQAVRVELASMVVSNIGTLNTMLSSNTVTAPLITTYGGILPAHVKTADLETANGWKDPRTDGGVRISVIAGGFREGVTSENTFANVGGNLQQIKHTSIYIYLHTHATQGLSIDNEASLRSVFCDVCEDFLGDGLFNQFANFTLPLSSQVYQPVGGQGFDTLSMCYVNRILRGFFGRGYGSSDIWYGTQAVHSGLIRP